MDRISSSSKAADLFGPGKHGFKDGNLATGTEPTKLNAEWFNGVQEEILAVIEAAGLAPAAANRAQLLESIRLIAAATGGLKTFAGYVTLPNGTILQWGTAQSNSAVGATGTAILFPVAFPNACWQVVMCDSGSACGVMAAGVTASKTSFTVWSKDVASTGAYASYGGRYFAVGN